MSTLIGTIQFRRDTAANWLLSNPVLLDHEFGYESDTGKVKKGNGITVWELLNYNSDPVVLAAIQDLQNQIDFKQDELGYVPEDASKKNATGGYPGLSGYRIQIKNAIGALTSFLQYLGVTSSRTWTLPDRTGTLADDTDLGLKVDKVAGKGLSTEDYTTTEKNKLAGAELLSNKGASNGYAPLVSGLIPQQYLPSFVDDILEFANLAAFPGTGETGKIYIALDSNKGYRWSGSVYIQITNGLIASTDDLPEGSTNKYWTNARTIGSVLTGFTSAASYSVVVAADSIIAAIGKLQKGVTDLFTSVSLKLDIASKAVFGDLNSGTDDDKYVTSLGLESSKYVGMKMSKISVTLSGVNTYTATLTPAITSYGGILVFANFANVNTSSTLTLALNGLSADSIILHDGSMPLAGSLRGILPLKHNGTSWQLLTTPQWADTWTVTFGGFSTPPSGFIAGYTGIGRVISLSINPTVLGTATTGTTTFTIPYAAAVTQYFPIIIQQASSAVSLGYCRLDSGSTTATVYMSNGNPLNVSGTKNIIASFTYRT